jgi:hypothetical protein
MNAGSVPLRPRFYQRLPILADGGKLFSPLAGVGDRKRTRKGGGVRWALWSAPTYAMYAKSSFGRTTWPRRALRVGLTTFFLNLDHSETAAQMRAYLTRT